MPQIEQLPAIFFSQLFWLAVVFGIIFFVIGRGMLPKVQSTVEAREKRIAEDLERAQAARAAAEQTEEAWRERMDAARAEAAKLAQDAREESARQTEAKVNEAADRINLKVEAAEGKIRDAAEAARAEIESVAAEATRELVVRLTGVKVDKKDAADAVKAEL
ncbi:MAG TPA: ATPase, partial [Sphingomicrobium sp.]|nr:ATPase [Sphingomicrobium sp.]